MGTPKSYASKCRLPSRTPARPVTARWELPHFNPIQITFCVEEPRRSLHFPSGRWASRRLCRALSRPTSGRSWTQAIPQSSIEFRLWFAAAIAMVFQLTPNWLSKPDDLPLVELDPFQSRALHGQLLPLVFHNARFPAMATLVSVPIVDKLRVPGPLPMASFA